MKRILLTLSNIGSLPKASPPSQPTSGPGGKEYAHSGVDKKFYGEGKHSFWIFHPTTPLPKHAEIVLFFHGWQCVSPNNYAKWIEHIVRRGRIVIFPTYQWHPLALPSSFLSNTIFALKNAFLQVQNHHSIPSDLRQLAFVGHSLGGVLAVNIAALAKENSLPQPKAILSVQPGLTTGFVGKRFIQLADLSKIPSETLLIALFGDDDYVTGKEDAYKIFQNTTAIPRERKNLVQIQTDNHGYPALVSDHLFPFGIDPNFVTFPKNNSLKHEFALKKILMKKFLRTDALSYFGTWKLFDALCDAAFFNKNSHYALGNTIEQRFMGLWSDDVPVKELKVIEPNKFREI